MKRVIITESQYKRLLKEFTEVMVMCQPWPFCMNDPEGKNTKTKWFIGRLEYNDMVEKWYPYSQDSNSYKTREEATKAYHGGLYVKKPL